MTYDLDLILDWIGALCVIYFSHGWLLRSVYLACLRYYYVYSLQFKVIDADLVKSVLLTSKRVNCGYAEIWNFYFKIQRVKLYLKPCPKS